MKASKFERFKPGERVWVAMGVGVTAPEGFVHEDKGGDFVTLAGFPEIPDVIELDLLGRSKVRRERVRKDKRGRKP